MSQRIQELSRGRSSWAWCLRYSVISSPTTPSLTCVPPLAARLHKRLSWLWIVTSERMDKATRACPPASFWRTTPTISVRTCWRIRWIGLIRWMLLCRIIMHRSFLHCIFSHNRVKPKTRKPVNPPKTPDFCSTESCAMCPAAPMRLFVKFLRSGQLGLQGKANRSIHYNWRSLLVVLSFWK